jgi:DNA (cytosine-5)-methyltransferase 1
MLAVKDDIKVEFKKIDFVQFIIIDLFCGAGGTTTGFEEAEFEYAELLAFLKSVGIDAPETYKELQAKMGMVVACVNHDHLAIKSHWENHKHVYHFEEDITLLYGIIKHGILFKSDQFRRLIRLVDLYRAFYPDAKIILWASLECTNFSKAKGGKSRDADSRTLADHIHPYIIALDPDYVMIENVVEFMSWGPMIPKIGKTSEGYPFTHIHITKEKKTKKITVGPHLIPESRTKGKDWLRWRKSICALGYRDEWRQMNSADFGALTSRNRLFGLYAKPGLPMVWPEPTHSKNPEKTSLITPLKKWEAVKHALDFEDEGQSVFNRKKALSTKTMQRLFMGCVKHIAGGKKAFMSRYYGGNSEYRNHDLDSPAGAITTNNRFALVKMSFLDKAYSGSPEDKNSSIESPAPVITTKPHESLVQAFVVKGHSSHSGKSVNSGASVEQPFPTLTTQSRERLAFIQKYNGNRDKTGGNNGKSIEEPAPVIACQPRLAVAFISRYNGVNGGKHDNSQPVDGPVGALGTGDNHAKVTANFLSLYYSNGGGDGSTENPAGTLPTKDRIAKVQAEFFIDKQFSGEANHQSIDQPAGSILGNDKHSLVKAEKYLMSTHFNNVGSSIEQPSPAITADRHAHYIINPSWGGNSGSIEEPCYVVIARQDKAPLYLITTIEVGPVAVPVYEDDCEWTIKLKEFMALYGIADIKMRMLKVPELKLIQGFPQNYVLLGSQADQKKFIGNSVHPKVPRMWLQAKSRRLVEETILKMAA